jgi:septal ring factor EnvC (AmiA/AmiB activator)
MNKQDEVAHIGWLIDQTPEGYVRDYLREARPFWEEGIRCDMLITTAQDLRDRRASLTEEVIKLEAKRKELEKLVADGRRTLDAIQGRAREARDNLRVADLALAHVQNTQPAPPPR